MKWLGSHLSIVFLGAAAIVASATASVRVSVSTTGEQADGDSYSPSVSADGRFVAFESLATNLVPSDTNGVFDVFVRDRLTGVTERVSVGTHGEQANLDSLGASISADGRYVAFRTNATNLAPRDFNGYPDVMVHDRLTGFTERVSVNNQGKQANDGSYRAAISADGTRVVFRSDATNLVNSDNNNLPDVFMRDLVARKTYRISISDTGDEPDQYSDFFPIAPAVTADGRFVAYHSFATNLVPGDMNFSSDIFLRDITNGTTVRVNMAWDGSEANADSVSPAVSMDGRYVAFRSQADNLIPDDLNQNPDVFLYDLQTGDIMVASQASDGSQANGPSYNPHISGDGRMIAFLSLATNLAPGPASTHLQLYVCDAAHMTTTLLSAAPDGLPGNDNSQNPAISLDGHWVTFDSDSTNLVADDTNGHTDIFIQDTGLEHRTVSGTVAFEMLSDGVAPPSSTPVKVLFNGVYFGTRELQLEPGGEFSLDVPNGLVTLSTKHSHWLRRTVTVDTSSTSVTDLLLSLTNGDATQDDRVDMDDLNQALLDWGSTQKRTDLDGDGLVGIFDVSTILVNFAAVGDP